MANKTPYGWSNTESTDGNYYYKSSRLGTFGSNTKTSYTYTSTRSYSTDPFWATNTAGYWVSNNYSEYGITYSKPKPPPTERFGKIANEYREDNNRSTEVQQSLGAEASARFEGLSEM